MRGGVAEAPHFHAGFLGGGGRDRRRGEDGFDFGFELGGVLVAEVGGLFEGAEDDLVEADVDVEAGDFGGGLEFIGGEFTGEHLVEDDAEGVEVGAVINGVGGGGLFGGHVLGGAGGCEVLSAEF